MSKKQYLILGFATILSIILWATSVIVWNILDIWIPFVIITILTIAIFTYTVIMYTKHVKFVCRNCNNIFRPKASVIIMAVHTPTTRLLKCPKCGKKTWCKDHFE